VRDDALAKLLDVAPEQAKDEVERIRRLLRSRDDFEVASALWTLAELRDEEALPAIDKIANAPRVPWLRKPASVSALLVRGQTDEVLEAIARHEHDRMKELAHAAAILGTAEAIEVLRRCSTASIDRECRGWCSWFLEWAASRTDKTATGRLTSESGRPPDD
jgi:HEAT repeat protein